MIPDPRRRRRVAPVCLVLACLLLPAARCRPEPAQDLVVMEIHDDLTARITVTTQLAAEDSGAREALEDYRRGRDPWLRGLERAGATHVQHQLLGSHAAPEGIERQAALETVDALVKFMPDAIANVRLLSDAERSQATLELIHIDRPAFLRDNHRKLAIAIGRLAPVWLIALDRACDIYDHLAESPSRAPALHRELSEDTPEGAEVYLLTPAEATMARRYRKAWSDVESLFEDEEEESEGMRLLLAARFGPFDHDLCFDLQDEAESSRGFERPEESGHPHRYCVVVKNLEQVMLDGRPRSDPPLGLGSLIEDPNAPLAEAGFSCERYGDARELERALWDQIEPLPRYELVWKWHTGTGV